MNQKVQGGWIAIVLDDRSFEYDAYTLVKAFYPGEPVHVYDTAGERENGRPDFVLLVQTAGGNVSVSCAEADGTAEIQAGDAGDRSDQGKPEEYGSLRPESGQLSQDRQSVKNVLKDRLYRFLCRRTGRTLPWGDLTGIRPVKLASEFLNTGRDSGETVEKMIRTYDVSRKKAELAVQIAVRERGILRQIHPEAGFSLYIGIPFCPSICLYCSFSSGTIGTWQKEADRYVDTLIREMEACGRNAERPCFPGRKLQSVYIGGGTPTALTAVQLDRVLCALEENYDMDSVLEFTVEAGRPDTITEDKLSVLKRHGVSRISINPQTMNQKTLDLIGRKHTAEQTDEAYCLARSMGFDCINMDLIVGLPGEGLPEVDYTMRRLEELAPDDITVHALALKRAARLALHMDEYESISFQASDAIMERTEETCRRLGMTPYYLYRQKNMAGNFENVGYAKEGCAGLYNILIMEEVQSILALGASASTKVIWPDGRIQRIENVKDVRSYLDRIDEMIARKGVLRAAD